jgi:hypothetical protein
MRKSLLFILFLCTSVNGFALDFQFRDSVLLTDINGITSGRLGRVVAINDGSVLMGAPEQDGLAGAAYQFQINAQQQLEFVKEFTPQDPSPFRYGGVLASNGDLLAVGYASDKLLEIYVRNGAQWSLSKILSAPEIQDVTIRGFGRIIDLKDDLLVVGDPSANVGSVSNAGVVMIFARNQGGANQWGLLTHFLDVNAPEEPNFPSDVAITSDLMVATDHFNDRALLFRNVNGSWAYSMHLQPEDFEVDDRFGVSVEAEGDHIAIGALNGNEAVEPSNSGSVHIFERSKGGANNFGQSRQITGSAPEFIDRFGESIRLREGLLVVGAPGAQQVYVFANLTGAWEEQQLILPPEGTVYGNAEFGLDVDYHKGSVIVGADRWNDIGGDRYGAVFMYQDRGVVLCGGLDGIYCDSFEKQ